MARLPSHAGVSTERLRLTIAYDGRDFRGWQSQATGDSVQDHLERVLAALCDERVIVHGSGRTDAGVHALGQIAHVDVPTNRLPLQRWAPALNAGLPPQIRVTRLVRAKPTFHARFDAIGKTYVYRIWNAPVLHPLEIGRAWFVPGQLDWTLLRETAPVLEGTHDFASFAAHRAPPRHRPVESDTVRTLHFIRMTRRGPLITLRFQGGGFLYRMVRLLTGSLVRVAQGRAPAAWLTDLLESKGAAKTSFAAPAEGLYLARVLY
ncbi:MAG: tRNA pseudouridine(38-40) synthase TruA [Chthoniobacteraceae bacterium]